MLCRDQGDDRIPRLHLCLYKSAQLSNFPFVNSRALDRVKRGTRTWRYEGRGGCRQLKGMTVSQVQSLSKRYVLLCNKTNVGR